MINKNDIKKVCTSIIKNDEKELYGKTQEELEEYWFFKFDDKLPSEQNLYEFISLIELYKSYCRRWEEHHNGSICVVERVRDKYLMPKINEFVRKLEEMKK